MANRVGQAVYGGGFELEDGTVVPFVLPGELVDGVGGVLEASADRIAPGCVHFGTCGGCAYQHAVYGEQVRLKEGILRELLAGLDVPEVGVISGSEWGYRNRVRFRVRRGAAGYEVGYSRRGTNAFLPVMMCPIAAPVLWRAAKALIRLGDEDAMCGRWLGTMTEVEVFTDGTEARLQMQFFLGNSDVARQKDQSFAEFCGRVKQRVPELAGAGAVMDPELGRRERRRWDGETWEADGLTYGVAGRSYWVSRGAFFQVNRFLVERLVERVTAGRTGGLAWDLYAGVGLFSRALAEGFKEVVAVEGGEAAAADLERAGRAKGLPGFTAVRAPIVEFLRAGVLQRERPDLVVLDPPRAGLGVEGSELLSRIGAVEVVYVSCDPVTLAKDLAVMVAGGYHAERVDLVDLFPQTFHMETVAVLRRG